MNKKVVNIIDDVNDITYDSLDNEELIINYFNHDNDDINITVNQNSNSKVVINYSAFNKKESNVNVKNQINGNNNKFVINVRMIALDKHANVNVTSKVKEGTINNEVIEDLKGLNENGTITLMPILEIDTNEVNAQHFATIGNYDKNQIFYLESKGISKDKAKELVKKSFIYNLFSEEFIKLLDKKE